MQVRLPTFEGPLDLLVYLVQKNEMDIQNIQLSLITSQYLEILKTMDEQNIEFASEFMVMAATLIYIKSRSLLPDSQKEEVIQEAQAIKEDIIKKIQEFQLYRELSKKIVQLPWKNRDFFTRPIEAPEVLKKTVFASIDLTGVVNSYQKCLIDARRELKLVKREYKSISRRVFELIPMLIKDPNTELSSLLGPDPSVQEIVITFISVLELSRLKKVEIVQQETMGPIKVTVLEDLSNIDFATLTGFEKEDVKKEALEKKQEDNNNEQEAIHERNDLSIPA